MYDDVMTRNEDGELAVRTVGVTEQATVVNPNDVYTRDTDGNLCIRTTGSGGGGGGSIDPHNLGYYATQAELEEAHPTAEAGDFAIVASTNTVWVWDVTNSEWVDSEVAGQVTSVNGQTGDVTVQETLVSGTNIKSVNGSSLLGSGNLELSTYLNYPAGWTTNSTTKAFCDDIAGDSGAVKGKAYLGEITCSDLPASMINAECVVEIIDGTSAANKVIVLTVTSGNTAPYMWKYTYWNNGSNVSGWQGFQPELVSGTNIKTVNNQSLLGGGNITVSSLPSQTGQSGKFLSTDGTDASWEDLPEEIPSQSGQSGKFLSTDGTNLSWETPQGGGGDFVPQYTSMPVASASNVGQLAQYKGADTNDYTNGYFYQSIQGQEEGTATISQTVGNEDTISFETTVGTITMSGTTQALRNMLEAGTLAGDLTSGTITFVYDANSDLWNFTYSDDGGAGGSGGQTPYYLKQYGFVFTGTPSDGDTVVCTYNLGNMWNLAVNVATFETQESTTGNYVFTYNGNDWTYDNQAVNLADYGISYDGTPYTDDALTVVYTEGAIIYSWEQTNVQPESASGIEWDAIIDLPDTYDGSTVNAMWTIAGGLPDGEYEFYFQTKCTADSATTTPFQMVTYKIVLSIYSDEYQGRYFKGFYAPVIDGNFMPDGNYVLNGSSTYWNFKLTVVGSDLIMWGSDRPFFQTDIPQYRSYTAVNECFKLSKIVNIQTGEEYSATGSILTNDPSGEDIIGNGLEYNLYQEQYIPRMQTFGQYSVSELATQNAGIMFYLQNDSAYKNIKSLNISLSHPDSNAEFEVNLIFGAYGRDCVQEIVKATGVFANCYVGYVEGGNPYITGFDATLAQTLSGQIYINSGSVASTQISNSMMLITGTMIPYAQGGNKAYRFDTPTVNSVGNILQYVGTTDANYTNGYFYKATGTIVTVPESITTDVFEPQGEATVTIDTTNFINALMTEYGWSRQQIEQWFNSYATSEFVCDYDIDNNEVVGITLPWHGGVFAPSILQCITVVYTGSQQTGQTYIRFYATYTPESKSVQNGSWELVNVQDVNTLLQSVTGYDATKTQVLKNVAGTLTWVDE